MFPDYGVKLSVEAIILLRESCKLLALGGIFISCDSFFPQGCHGRESILIMAPAFYIEPDEHSNIS